MKNCKNRIVAHLPAVFVFLTLLIFFSGCANKEGEEIKIGVMLPLTGSAASLGVPALNGVKLAIDQANEVRPDTVPKLSLVVEDTKALPADGLSAAQKLKRVHKVRIAIGPLTSTVTLAVAPFVEKNQLLIISPGASAPSITYSGDYIFRNELSDSVGGKIQAEIAYHKLGYRNMATVYINTDYGAGLEQVFRKTFLSLGGNVSFAESFEQGETDFRSIISKIRSIPVDAIFLIAIDETINFIKQKAELGFSSDIYATPIFENEKYLRELGSLAEGIYYVYYGIYDPDSQREQIKSFVSSYSSMFNEPPTYYSALSYDAANLIILALNMANYVLDGFKTSMYNIRDYKGVTGSTSFDHNGDVVKPVSLKVVREGTFVFVD